MVAYIIYVYDILYVIIILVHSVGKYSVGAKYLNIFHDQKLNNFRLYIGLVLKGLQTFLKKQQNINNMYMWKQVWNWINMTF